MQVTLWNALTTVKCVYLLMDLNTCLQKYLMDYISVNFFWRTLESGNHREEFADIKPLVEGIGTHVLLFGISSAVVAKMCTVLMFSK